MAQTTRIAGGAPSPSLGATPPADGAGSSSSSTFSAPAQSGVSTRLGMSVTADLFVDALQFTRSIATSEQGARCLGLVVKLTPSGTLAPATAKEQGAGIVTLTTLEWDSVTGDTGGLEIGSAYYVSDASAGEITRTKPTTPGNYVTIVGYGLSATEMQLQISAPVLIP